MFLPKVVILVIAAHVIRTCYRLWQNIAIARASGLKFVLVPIYPYNRLALVLTRPLLRLLDRIWPNPALTSWRRLIGSGWLWSCRHATFAELGTDNFLVVAPSGIVMYTADADVITQVLSRDGDFPKAVALSKPIDLYGPNMLSAEGAAWRRQRKLVTQAFSEKNNELVWDETLRQSQTMIESWLRAADEKGKTIRTLADDTMRLSLSVISRAALGQSMDWSWGNDYRVVSNDQKSSASHSHTMSFTNSLQYLLGHILYLVLYPKWLLRIVPSKTMAKCHQASDELRRYMHEMVSAKRATSQREELGGSSATDLLSNLLRAQSNTVGQASKDSSESSSMTEGEIIGNLFIFFIAGHETAANSIHFSLLLLALNPNAQRKVQQDLDHSLNGRTMSDWDYKRDFPLLLNSLLGAVLAEELRLITPILSIPKQVGSSPQSLTVGNHQVHVPPNTIVRLCVQAVHRNPRFWPNSAPIKSKKGYFPPSNTENDLEEFKPERWFGSKSQSSGEAPFSNTTSSLNKLYSPPRGAYLPFSFGQRACTGQRFAQVEVMCALAVILSQYTVELAVDSFASDEEVARMDSSAKAQVWGKARDAADKIWQKKMGCVLTLQIRGAFVPVRFVKRGLERFADVEG